MPSRPVYCNFYNMGKPKKAWDFSPYVFHCGIEVDGIEVSLRLVEDERTGERFMGIGEPYQPRHFPKLNSMSNRYEFVESHLVGRTDLTDEEIEQIIRKVLGDYARPDDIDDRKWTQSHPRFREYHNYNHNCNHFACDVAKALTGNGIPAKAYGASVAAKMLSLW